jgi:apolipoprotein N-acyltransferase
MTRSLVGATVAAMLLWAALRVDARFGWLVCAPLVAASPRGGRTWGRAAVLGLTFALEVALTAHARWLGDAAERYFLLPHATALAVAIALCVVCAAPMGVLLGLLLRSAAALTGARSIAASAAVWVAWEHLTRISFPSYPWVGLAATQADTASVLQAASIAGQGGLSLVLAASGRGRVRCDSAVARSRRRGPPASGLATILFGVVLVPRPRSSGGAPPLGSLCARSALRSRRRRCEDSGPERPGFGGARALRCRG